MGCPAPLDEATQDVEVMAMVHLGKVVRSYATFWSFWPWREGFSKWVNGGQDRKE